MKKLNIHTVTKVPLCAFLDLVLCSKGLKRNPAHQCIGKNSLWVVEVRGASEIAWTSLALARLLEQGNCWIKQTLMQEWEHAEVRPFEMQTPTQHWRKENWVDHSRSGQRIIPSTTPHPERPWVGWLIWWRWPRLQEKMVIFLVEWDTARAIQMSAPESSILRWEFSAVCGGMGARVKTETEAAKLKQPWRICSVEIPYVCFWSPPWRFTKVSVCSPNALSAEPTYFSFLLPVLSVLCWVTSSTWALVGRAYSGNRSQSVGRREATNMSHGAGYLCRKKKKKRFLTGGFEEPT